MHQSLSNNCVRRSLKTTVLVPSLSGCELKYCLNCRWGFVTHGCIDGYSRVITFLQTSTSNEAMVVLNLFAQACAKLGLPSRVRCDRGGENMDVAIFMTLVRGDGRASVIAGQSVHNQRIERLWRDVATQVTEYFYKLFYQFEDEGVLDVDDQTHLCALQLVFLPVINARMNNFRQAWNSHRMRTEENRSPQQLWIQGMLQNANSGHVATAQVFDQPVSLLPRIQEALQQFNIDLEQFQLHQAGQGLQPPQPRFVADSDAVARVQAAVVGLTDLKDMYTTAVHILRQP